MLDQRTIPQWHRSLLLEKLQPGRDRNSPYFTITLTTQSGADGSKMSPISGWYAMAVMSAPILVQLVIQHAGPKLRGYPTSTASRVTVIQKAAPGFFRSSLMPVIVTAGRRGWKWRFGRHFDLGGRAEMATGVGSAPVARSESFPVRTNVKR